MENKEKKGGEVKIPWEEKKQQKEISLRKTDTTEKEGFFQYVDVRIISLFVAGFLLGLVIKTQATKSIVMGANDPRLEKTRGNYMLTEIGKTNEEDLEEGEAEDDDIDADADADADGEESDL